VAPAGEPYRTLGVDPSVSDEALHDAYRRLVKAAHPDRNGGTPEATRRFVEIQSAYEQATAERRRRRTTGAPPRPPRRARRPTIPAVEARLADLERQVHEARSARERAAQAARDALREVQGDEEIHLPSDDEDSFSKLLADAATELGERLDGAREHPDDPAGLEMLAASSGSRARPTARRRAGRLQRTGTSSRSLNGATSSISSPLQKRPGSYQLAGRRLGSRPICW
jgi:curved DNA-binding protein CbpA